MAIYTSMHRAFRLFAVRDALSFFTSFRDVSLHDRQTEMNAPLIDLPLFEHAATVLMPDQYARIGG